MEGSLPARRADRLSWCGLRDAQPTRPSRRAELQQARLQLGSVRGALRRADRGRALARQHIEYEIEENRGQNICGDLKVKLSVSFGAGKVGHRMFQTRQPGSTKKICVGRPSLRVSNGDRVFSWLLRPRFLE